MLYDLDEIETDLDLARKLTGVGVIFDEIGLAEVSPENPLKCLHGLLEPQKGMDIGFIGLSNWFLDLSKMSRMLLVFRNDMNMEQLVQTTTKLAQNVLRHDSIEQSVLIKHLHPVFVALSGAYLDFLQNTQN